MSVASPVPPTSGAPAASPPPFEPAALAMLMRVGGARLVRDLAELYRSYAPARLREARTSATLGDPEGVRRACHALRSGGAQLGLAAMAAACLAAERESEAASLAALVREVERAQVDGMARLARQLDALGAT